MIKSIMLVISLIVSLSMFAVVFFSKQTFKGTRKAKMPVRIRSDISRK